MSTRSISYNTNPFTNIQLGRQSHQHGGKQMAIHHVNGKYGSSPAASNKA